MFSTELNSFSVWLCAVQIQCLSYTISPERDSYSSKKFSSRSFTAFVHMLALENGLAGMGMKIRPRFRGADYALEDVGKLIA